MSTPFDCHLHISLLSISPLIWRRLHVPSTFRLVQLHSAFQIAMGWGSAHMHEFSIAGRCYAPGGDLGSGRTLAEEEIAIAELAPAVGDEWQYIYDFGDDWIHTVLIEGTMEPDPGRSYPFCSGGERNCPPEDSGGPWRYPEFLQALADPAHPEHREVRKWARGFDPEKFDVAAVNRRLALAFGLKTLRNAAAGRKA